jgi:hypothetical protein
MPVMLLSALTDVLCGVVFSRLPAQHTLQDVKDTVCSHIARYLPVMQD